MSDEAMYCIDSAILLFAEKQKSFSGSFVNKGWRGCYSILRKLEIKSRVSVS